MILPGTRRLLLVFAVLTLLAFVVLFVFAAETDAYFAWTIKPPATAAWLGAAYAGGCALQVLALRNRSWVAIRVPFLAIAIFTVLTLLATLLHLELFHLVSGTTGGRVAAWFWLAVYVVVPVWMILALAAQERRGRVAGGRQPKIPIPLLLRILLLVQGAVLLGAGAALYLRPSTAGVLWPWTLTPLTARAIASWLVALGFAAVLIMIVNELAELGIAIWAYAIFAVLELVVAVRFLDTVRWNAASWVYLGLCAFILVSAAYALLVRGRARQQVGALPGG